MKNKILVFLLALIFTGFTFGCGRQKETIQTKIIKEPGMICDFEDIKVWDISPEEGFNLTLSKENVTEGNYSLKVDYPVDSWPSINTRKLRRNWRDSDYFCLDIFNPQGQTLSFTIRLDDLSRNRANIEWPLDSGMNNIRIPLSQIASQIDISSISFVVLFLNSPQQRYTLYFDNMRLKKEVNELQAQVEIQKTEEAQKSFTEEIMVWAVDDCIKIRPEDSYQEQNYIWNGVSKTISLYGAKNEYVGFQLIIKAEGKDLSGVNIIKSDLIGRSAIDKSNIQLFREHYLKVNEPSTSMYGQVSLGKGEYPDPLIPFDAPKDGAPFNVLKGRNQPVWVDIYIPSQINSGLYKGCLTVEGKELEPVEININLEIWDFALPDETHLKSFFYYGPEQIKWAHRLGSVDYESDQFLSLELEYHRMAHQHRVNLATDVYNYGDWLRFLNRAGRYLDGSAFVEGAGAGVGVSVWPLGEAFDTSNKDRFQEACKWYMAHFQQEGWLDKPFLYVIDEPNDKESYDEVRKIGEWIDKASYPGNKLPFMVTEQVKPQRPEFGSLIGYVDIWCSGSGFPEDMDERRKAGDRIWTYNGGPDGASQIIDTYGLTCRSWAWTAWRYNIECWFLWDCTYWVDKHNLRGRDLVATDIWNNPLTFDQRRNPNVKYPDWGNGDGVFFYPGYEKEINGPISSFRMKAFRRGMQDYEYLYLLKELGKKETADQIANSLNFKTNKEPQKWYEARIKLAEEILK